MSRIKFPPISTFKKHTYITHGKTHIQIDHVLVDKRRLSNIVDVWWI